MMNLIDKYNDVIMEVGVMLFGVLLIGMMWIMCLSLIPGYGIEMAIMACVLFSGLVGLVIYEVKRVKETLEEVRSK